MPRMAIDSTAVKCASRAGLRLGKRFLEFQFRAWTWSLKARIGLQYWVNSVRLTGDLNVEGECCPQKLVQNLEEFNVDEQGEDDITKMAQMFFDVACSLYHFAVLRDGFPAKVITHALFVQDVQHQFPICFSRTIPKLQAVHQNTSFECLFEMYKPTESREFVLTSEGN
ncbi:hypothetical protein BDN72DRAFT_854804 [Pluteus cervinus]|uniref:Uncharacterized protein n=1 Tax=Pluteus cervinus TaxID=181527 RepID=A0ACD3B6A2_9AGAR|nr:hypothetical protein BDN72DRAFT_854804 [Pluteus cervinus]